MVGKRPRQNREQARDGPETRDAVPEDGRQTFRKRRSPTPAPTEPMSAPPIRSPMLIAPALPVVTKKPWKKPFVVSSWLSRYWSANTPLTASPAPTAPCTSPSAMKGMRTNQFEAPTSFITSISRRRAKVARRIVFTMRNSDEAMRIVEIAMNMYRRKFVMSMSCLIALSAVIASSTPGLVLYLSRNAVVRFTCVGATRNDAGSALGSTELTRSGLSLKIRLKSLYACSLEMYLALLIWRSRSS